MNKTKFREPIELSDELMEFRDHIIEELKSRTGSQIVNIIAYKENQELEPLTIRPHQIILECRVGNQTSKMVVSEEQFGFNDRILFYSFRDISNRMIDTLIKAGAQALC